MTLRWSSSDPAPSTAVWELRYNTQIFTSPLTQSTQAVALPGARWLTQWKWDALDATRLARVLALLTPLRGRAATILLPHLGFRMASIYPDIQRSVQSATTNSIVYNGFEITAGDRIQCEGDEVKLVTAASASTLAVEPAFRSIPATGSAISLRPHSRMRLDHDGLATQLSAGGIYALSASFSEAL